MKPIPEDFEKYAYEPIVSLRKRYGVGENTVYAWRKKVGIGRVGSGRAKKIMDAYQDEIAVCLNCTMKNCNGQCSRFAR